MTNYAKSLGQTAVVLGSQWGDEGKGKLIDILSSDYDIVARAAGGANAGHTIYINGKKHVFHLVPSGMLNDGCICLIGNGVALHLETLMKEINLLEENNISCAGRILIANRTHLLFDYHKIIDGMQEEMKGKQKVGTTKRGIGPCYTDKVRRNGIRVHELLDFDKFEKKYRSNLEMFKKMYGDFEYNADEELAKHREFTRQIEKYIVDGAYYLHKALKENKRVLVEGANGALLDIDHGTYPYVTSSNPTIGGILTGTGLNAGNLENVIGIMKAYTTRVGAGPFPSELLDELGESIRENGGEYGATTGRPRRCGWFDAVIGSYSVMVNGMTEVNLTKLDVLTGIPELKIATEYHYDGNKLEGFPADLNILKDVEVKYETFEGWEEDISEIRDFKKLPENAKTYVKAIEKHLNCKISSIGVGVDRHDMIFI